MIDDNYFIAGTNRGTHFSGFAALVIAEMANQNLFDSASRRYDEMQALLAQCAYDFALYIMKDAPVTEWEWDMRDIKDLAEWPTPPASAPASPVPD